MPITNVASLPPHKTKHQTGGADEVSIASLAGSPAQKAAASGLASLDATSKVVQDPATSFIPLAQKAAASGVASLDASSVVVQQPPAIDLSKITSGWDKQSFINLLENGDFEVGDPPTGWNLIGAGASFSRSAVQVKIGSYSALLTRVGNDCLARFNVSLWAHLKNRTVALGCWIYATVANRAKVSIYDGINVLYSSYHSGVAGWEWLGLTLTVDSGATTVTVDIRVDTGDTSAYFDGAMLVEGNSCPAFSPKPRSIDVRVTKAGLEWTSAKLLKGAGAGADPTEIDAPTIVRKTADETVNNSTTLQNDDHLLLAVGVNEVWVLSLYLIIATTAVADFKLAFTVPAGGAAYYYEASGAPLVSYIAAPNAHIFSTAADTTSGKAIVYCLYIGGGTAGNLQLQWCQANLEATNTRVLTNSCIIAHKVA